MTGAEIIKGLECCNRADNAVCDDCPYNEYNRVDAHYPYSCQRYLRMDALALIKRQRVEIEKLIDECGSQSVLWRDHFAGIYETAKETIKAEARTEAIREFAERLDGYLTVNCTIEKNAVKSSIADDDIYFHGGKEIAFADVKQRIISILQELTEEQK